MEKKKFYELKELRNLLPIHDLRVIKKWLQEHHIAIQVIAGRNVVNCFLVDMEIDKPLVKELKNHYPKKWKQLYECYRDNDRLGYLLLLDEDFKVANHKDKLRFEQVSEKSKLAAKFLED